MWAVRHIQSNIIPVMPHSDYKNLAICMERGDAQDMLERLGNLTHEIVRVELYIQEKVNDC